MRVDVSLSLDNGDRKKSGKVETTHWADGIIPPFSPPVASYWKGGFFYQRHARAERDAWTVLLNWQWSIRIGRAPRRSLYTYIICPCPRLLLRQNSMPPSLAPDIWIKAIFSFSLSQALTNCSPPSVAALQVPAHHQPHQSRRSQGRQDCVSCLLIFFSRSLFSFRFRPGN